jgi:ACS family hexuronate transporter-like MFS transporter
VVGIGGMAGAIGGILLAKAAGRILQLTHNYLSLFLIAGSVYLIALLLLHLLLPQLEPAALDG